MTIRPSRCPRTEASAVVPGCIEYAETRALRCALTADREGPGSSDLDGVASMVR